MVIGQQLEAIEEIIFQITIEKFSEFELDAYLAGLVTENVANRFKRQAYKELLKEYTTQTEAFERLQAFCRDLDLDALNKESGGVSGNTESTG